MELKDGKPYKLKVTNTCINKDGKSSKAIGWVKAISSDYRGLAVSFAVWTDWMDDINYQILYLDKDYTRVLVGSLNKKYMWILSRQVLSSEEIQNLLKIAKEYGYDTTEM